MAISGLIKPGQEAGLALRRELVVDGQRGCAGVEGVCLL